MFTAIKNNGSFLNDKQIFADHELKSKVRILASRSEIKRGEFEIFERDAHIIPVGSIAYKLALIAKGDEDATFSLGPKNEWDIAAGVLLVQESNGIVSDKYWNNYVFNQSNTLVNSIVAITKEAYPLIQRQINSVLS